MNRVLTGLDEVMSQPPSFLAGRRLGLLTNPTGLNQDLISSVDLFASNPELDLRALYGPEHGVRGDAQAGDHVDTVTDARTGLPVMSLYGETRTPTPAMLNEIDTMVIDLQDIGVRYATYLSSIANVLQGCAVADVDVVVLDRPNPLGGDLVGGQILDPTFASFIGLPGLPVLHGLTVGEFARWWTTAQDLPAPIVIPMRGWRRSMWFDDTSLPWVLPSPNLPTLDSVTCYPATCLIEGTNLSEGRGTTRPFECLGAPWIDPERIAGALNALNLPGVRFRGTWFAPWISKHRGEACGGVQLYVKDRYRWDPITTGCGILATIHRHYPDQFAWVESTEGGMFIDLLAGTDRLRRCIDDDLDLTEFLERGRNEALVFAENRRQWLLEDYAE
jgi:uncharacterized protein YbbC (DUF1343 family)